EGLSRVDHPLVQTVCRYYSKGGDCPNDVQLQPGSFVPLPHMPLAGVTLAACVGKPRATGTIRFVSARAQDPPVLSTALLSDEADRVVAREALGWIAKLARTRALAPLARPVY